MEGMVRETEQVEFYIEVSDIDAGPRFTRHVADSILGNFYWVEWKAIREYLSAKDLSGLLADAPVAQAA